MFAQSSPSIRSPTRREAAQGPRQAEAGQGRGDQEEDGLLQNAGPARKVRRGAAERGQLASVHCLPPACLDSCLHSASLHPRRLRPRSSPPRQAPSPPQPLCPARPAHLRAPLPPWHTRRRGHDAATARPRQRQRARYPSAGPLPRRRTVRGLPASAAPAVDAQPRTLLDKVADALLGVAPEEANPLNRYALICGQCYAHNGLAKKEEFDFVRESAVPSPSTSAPVTSSEAIV